MLERLKAQVCEANLRLVSQGLVIQTFGNASGVDRPSGCMIIKPSGVAYLGMKPEHMVVVSLETGAVLEGDLKPSSDTPTHLVLYRAFPEIGGIVHTHSLFATAWSQAEREIPAFGTTHADYFHGSVPCTRRLRSGEIRGDYETNTGRVIIERLRKLDPLALPGVLVASHGPFSWGHSADEAVHNAVIMEFLARLAAETLRINAATRPVPGVLLDKHYFRKHGAGAYYGQCSSLQPQTESNRSKSRKRNT